MKMKPMLCDETEAKNPGASFAAARPAKVTRECLTNTRKIREPQREPPPPPRPREPIGCAEDSSLSVLRGSPVCAAAPSSHFGGQPLVKFFDSGGQKGTV